MAPKSARTWLQLAAAAIFVFSVAFYGVPTMGFRGAKVARVKRNPAMVRAAMNAGGADGTSCAELESLRGEYVEADVIDLLRKYGYPRMWHTVIDESCPKFVVGYQNYAAGIGHRMSNWAMALHTAMTYNVTFAHTGFDGGGGRHGNYDGWDAWLGFTEGEIGVDDVMKRPGIKKVALPSGGQQYTMNEAITKQWREIILRRDNPAEHCNVLYVTPQDEWMYDISTLTKAIMSVKFAAAMRKHKAAGEKMGLLPGPVHQDLMEKLSSEPEKKQIAHYYSVVTDLVWNPADINIAVHIRVGDQYPTPERVHAEVLRTTILPELGAAGIRGLRTSVHVHVFAEGADRDTFPEIAAIDASPLLAWADAAGKERRPGDGGLVTVHFWPNVDAMRSFYHLTIADFSILSFSSFSQWAAHLALKPLSYSQPSSDIYRMCGEAVVCCFHSGDCSFAAQYRTKQAATRLAALERCSP